MPLGEICEFRYGKGLRTDKRNGGSVPVYGSNGIVGWHDASLIDGPSIVIGRKGSFGEVHFTNGRSWPIDTTYYVDGRSTDTDLRWLFWLLGSLNLKDLNRAAAIPGLNREDAYRIKVSIPPLPEQRRIAEILDRADALRAKRREAIAKLDSLTQSIFIDMFGDATPQYSLGEVAAVQGGLQVSAARRSLPRLVMYLRVANVYRNRVDLSEVKEIRVTEAEIDRTRLAPGDLLVVEGHGNPNEIGRVAMWGGELPVCVHQNHLIRVRCNPELSPIFASQYLNSPFGRRHLVRKGKSTSGLNTISTSDVKSTPIPVPSKVEQETFERRTASIERARGCQGDSLRHLDVLFASLQHRAFSGLL